MDTKYLISVLVSWTPDFFFGFMNNLLISCLAMLAGSFLGLLIVLLRSGKQKKLSSAGRGITNLVRNVPSFVLMFYLAFVMPYSIEIGSLRFTIPPLLKASLALTLPVAGFTADALMGVLRTGKDKEINPHVVFWSGWWSYFIVVLMASSTASVIGVNEIVAKANLLIASLNNQDYSFFIYIYTTLWFLAAGIFFTYMSRYLSKAFNRFFFRKGVASFLLIFATLLSLNNFTYASEKRAEQKREDKIYKVAVRNSPPFIIMDEFKNLNGISIDLWETIAGNLKIKYEYRFMKFTDSLDALKKGTIDIVISPLTITKEREKIFDFSNQYFPSGLTFASMKKGHINIEYAVKNLKKVLSSPYILSFMLVFFIFFLLYLFLSYSNLDKYAGSEIDKDTGKTEKIISFSIITFLMTIGIDKGIFRFRSVFMQLFSLLLIFFGITVSASTFGLITATLTQSINYQPVYDMNSVASSRIAVMEGSTAERFLSGYQGRIPFEIVGKKNPEESVNSLLKGEADLIFGDWAQLMYWANNNEAINVQNSFLKFEPYGWGFPEGSGIREEVNQELIYLIRNKEWWKKRVKQYLGKVSLLSLN